MTTKKVLIFVALMAFVLMMIAPVCATNWSMMEYQGNISVGDWFAYDTPEDICAQYDSTYAGGSYINNWIFWGAAHGFTDIVTGAEQNALGTKTNDSGYLIPTNEPNFGDTMYSTVSEQAMCNMGDYGVYKYWWISDIPSVTPVSSFTCVPTSQYLNTDVVCTDTSINMPTSWLWTVDYPALGITDWQTSTSRNFSWQSAYAGTFSVNLRATNGEGFDWENKTNYVSISGNPYVTVTPTPAPTIPPGYVRTEIATYDVYGAIIQGTNIQIKDVETGVWKNSTGDTDGVLFIDTLPYHTLNAYGQFTTVPNQYQDASALGLSTGYDGGVRFWLILYPYNPDVEVGETVLYVTVLDNNGLIPITQALVSVESPGNATKTGYTSFSGIKSFIVPNSTILHITAQKYNYQTGGTTMNSGTGTTAFANIVLDFISVTPVPTLTIGPGGTVPTTYLPGIGPTSSAGQVSKAQDNEMMNKIRSAGPYLIDLAILATMMGLLYLIMGKK